MGDPNFTDAVLLIDASNKGVGTDANWTDVVLLLDASAAVEDEPPPPPPPPPLTEVRLPALEFFSWQERVLAFASDPPATPDKGDRYIIEATATGAWEGHEGSIAWWDGDAWRIDGPFDGWVVYNLDNSTAYIYHVGWNPVLVVGFGGGVVAVSPDGSEVRVIGIDNSGDVEARVL